MQTFLDCFCGFDGNYPAGLYVADADGTLYVGQEVERSERNTVLREPDGNGNYINNGRHMWRVPIMFMSGTESLLFSR